jgi:hypothetical protein
MVGISWGGFNALQIAALKPPELKAVITVASTDDRYADDVHYMGGCLLGDNLSWAAVMFAHTSLPPDPETVGERWRALWMERLEGSGMWLEEWLRHQHRDAYWRHGSICEDWSAVQVPVFAVSGWADGYSNSVFRMLANLPGPRKGLIGPWSHRYPQFGVPGPAIDFLGESLRWWDQWLKGRDTGIMDEPMLRVWMQDSVPPTTRYDHRPGRWAAEDRWPSPRVELRTHALAPGRIVPAGAPDEAGALTLQSPLTVGLFAGKWCSYSATPDLPHDQREEDGGALTFDTEPLPETVEILGAPELELELSADQPVAMLAARLSDVAPDDKATRVTYGLLNLTHRESHEHPKPLEPGRPTRVRLRMNGVAQTFPAGHRIRLSLSTSYWPMAWPPPRPVRLSLHVGGSRLTLPVRPPRDEDRSLPPFGEPATAPPLRKRQITETHHNWLVQRDLENDVSTLEVIKDEGTYRIEEIDLEVTDRTREWYSSRDDDFHSVRGEVLSERGLRRGDWKVRTVTHTVLTCDAENFYLHADLDAYEDEFRVYSRSWEHTIPRSLV